MPAGSEYRMGDAIAGRYLIESKLGESPTSQLYLANENHSARKLALKIYRAEISAGLLQETDFFLKAAVQTTPVHEGQAQVYEILEDMGLVIVAREWIEGTSFETFARDVASQGRGLTKGMEILWQVSQTLSVIHGNNLHLRLHPQNLILGPLMAKLVDGDPRALPFSDLVPASLPFRPEYRGYLSPEARGRGFVAYPNSDLYGLAAMLFRLVTGENPGEDARHHHQRLQALRLDREIESFIIKAMHPKPEDRFATADVFADALWSLQPHLERMQESFAPSAPPPSPPPTSPAPTEFGPPPNSHFRADTPPPPYPSGLEAPATGSTLFGSAPSDPFAVSPATGGSDTLFGNPPPSPEPPPRIATDFFAKPATPARAPSEFSFKPPTAAIRAFPPPQPPQPAPSRGRSPVKPVAPTARMSSLESDTADPTLSGSDTGLTQFGFQGSNGDRTGDFGQEQVRKKRRLVLTLGIVAAFAVIALMVVLYFVLRAATPRPQIAQTDLMPVETEISGEASPTPEPVPADPELPATASVPSQAATPTPPPDQASPEATGLPDYQDALDAPVFEQVPMAVTTEDPPATPPPVSAPKLTGNAKVSSERRAQIETDFKQKNWPASAADRIRMADDFNDLGMIAEANLCYKKAADISPSGSREKTLALGGMAVTFKNMGMRKEALDAVNELLAMNPNNRFALGLKAELR